MKIETKTKNGYTWKYFYMNGELKKVVNITLKRKQREEKKKLHRRWGLNDENDKGFIPD